LLKTNSNE